MTRRFKIILSSSQRVRSMKRKITLLPIVLLVAPPRWWLNLTQPIDLTDPIGAGLKGDVGSSEK